MGKDNRTILRAPRIGLGAILDEDELAAALTPEQGQILLDNGSITGDWTFTGGPVVSQPGSEPLEPTFTVDDVRAEMERQEAAFNASWATLTEERDNLKAANAKLTADLAASEAKVKDLTTKNAKLTADLKAATATPPTPPTA